MNTIDKKYTDLLQDILDNGTTKSDRTGTGTISVFGRQIRHRMSEGFPLLTTKKMYFKGIVTELLWFLRGDTNIKYLVDNDCHIWDGDAYKNYYRSHTSPPSNPGGPLLSDNLVSVRPIQYSKEGFINKIKTDDEFAKTWGELGPIYGKQWRSWRGQDGMVGEKDENGTRVITWNQIDQIANLINELKTNPDSRRMMVNAWSVGELDSMVLPPCHYGFQVYTRELSDDERYELCAAKKSKMTAISEDDYIKYNIPTRAISLMWNQRSVDVPLGLPFNIASYGLLLEIIAKEVNMVPDELIGNLGDCHIYTNQIDGVKEQIGRELSIDERMDWWFHTRKPNRDVCDSIDEASEYAKGLYFDSAGVPKRTREPFELPTLKIADENLDTWKEGKILPHYEISDFVVENYKSHPAIKMPLSN